MKPWGLTWRASQTPAALAPVVGSLLAGAPAAGAAVSSTNPTAIERNGVRRMRVSSLIVPGATGEDSSTGSRALPSRKPSTVGGAITSRGYPGSQKASTSCLRLRVSAGLRPASPTDAPPLDHPAHPTVKRV